jgi:riboflavin kinase / FMN adenylyltransferase
VTVGNFDGVHRGHAALVADLRRQAAGVHGPAVVVTFDPHPLKLLRPQQFMPVLTTPRDRAQLLLDSGADHVVILHTTPQLLQVPAPGFFEHFLAGGLRARAVVEGANFAFGHNREGTVETLRELCRQRGIGLTVVPEFRLGGVPVSSSRVRAALTGGAVREAAELLGRPYSVRGIVGTGQRRGATIGFPTANLERVEMLLPADGVYAVRASVRGETWPAAANLGPNPTFGEDARKLEVHLIGFRGDLYGTEMVVDFLDRLRDTRPFRGVDELVAQLRQDVEQARRIAAP